MLPHVIFFVKKGNLLNIIIAEFNFIPNPSYVGFLTIVLTVISRTVTLFKIRLNKEFTVQRAQFIIRIRWLKIIGSESGSVFSLTSVA